MTNPKFIDLSGIGDKILEELDDNTKAQDCFTDDPELFVSLLFARTAVEKIQLKLDQLQEVLEDDSLSESNRKTYMSMADDLTQCVMHCMTAVSELREALGLDSLNP